MQIIEKTLPSHWASYLINLDSSGLHTGEKEEIDAFLAKNKLPFPASCSDEEWFSRYNDAGALPGNVMEFSFLVESDNPRKVALPCSAGHITWHAKGYQCLNCGATAEHSWNIKHAIQPKGEK